jgi:adenine/guanine phosphoribosyltransferase-like PRPP-binding protein
MGIWQKGIAPGCSLCVLCNLSVVLAKKDFKLEKDEYEGIANLGPDQALNLLYRLYEFLTKKKLNL